MCIREAYLATQIWIIIVLVIKDMLVVHLHNKSISDDSIRQWALEPLHRYNFSTSNHLYLPQQARRNSFHSIPHSPVPIIRKDMSVRPHLHAFSGKINVITICIYTYKY